MLLICPNCVTSYQVDASVLGASGRSVRCVRCRTVWMAMPPAPQEFQDPAVAAFASELGQGAAGGADANAAPAQEPAADQGPPGEFAANAAAEMAEAPSIVPDEPLPDEPAAAPDSSEVQAHDDAPPLQPMTEPVPAADAAPAGPEPADNIESFAARRGRKPKSRKRTAGPAMLPLAIVALIGIVAALVAARGTIVRHAPQMASLYSAIGLTVNLRGLEFEDVATSNGTHDGVPILVVEGRIVNTTRSAVEVPRLRFAVRNGSGEAYAWTAQPAKSVLAAGETMPFRSRLASPPPEMRDVVVRFFNRRDAAAGAN